MKLKKEDYKKTTYSDGSVSYDYTCKGNTFYIRVVGYGVDRTMFVYKNDEYETNLQNVFTTKDNLLAWNEFERLVNECSDKPQSSGGFSKNPQANPFALPLLAIYFDTNINKWSVNFFVQVDLGQVNAPSQQVKLLDFTLESNQFTMPTSSAIVSVDWSGFDIPDVFKCEVMLKKFDKVEFEENKSADVFLFIPKSIIPPEQGGDGDGGGEDDGGEEGGDEKGDKKGKKKGDKGDKGEGEPTDEPTNEDGEPTDEDGKPSDKGKPTDKPSDEDGKPQYSDEPPQGDNGKPTDEDGQPKYAEKPMRGDDEDKNRKEDKITYVRTQPSEEPINPPPSDLLQALSDSVGLQRNVIEPFFSRVNQGEIFLLGENFEKIKSDLNLPKGITPRQLAESINQQLQ